MPQRKRRENQFILREFQLKSYLQAFEETVFNMWERWAPGLLAPGTKAMRDATRIFTKIEGSPTLEAKVPTYQVTILPPTCRTYPIQLAIQRRTGKKQNFEPLACETTPRGRHLAQPSSEPHLRLYLCLRLLQYRFQSSAFSQQFTAPWSWTQATTMLSACRRQRQSSKSKRRTGSWP